LRTMVIGKRSSHKRRLLSVFFMFNYGIMACLE
jgi:hypothetical protein